MAKTDEEKAAFLRSVGATHGEWLPSFDGNEMLSKLTLGPAPQPGPAARMADFHERTALTAQERQHAIMFAASSVRPNMRPTSAAPPSAVPRAVRAKEAARRGQAQG